MLQGQKKQKTSMNIKNNISITPKYLNMLITLAQRYRKIVSIPNNINKIAAEYNLTLILSLLLTTRKPHSNFFIDCTWVALTKKMR